MPGVIEICLLLPEDPANQPTRRRAIPLPRDKLEIRALEAAAPSARHAPSQVSLEGRALFPRELSVEILPEPGQDGVTVR
jgi:hypothetical protein